MNVRSLQTTHRKDFEAFSYRQCFINTLYSRDEWQRLGWLFPYLYGGSIGEELFQSGIISLALHEV